MRRTLVLAGALLVFVLAGPSAVSPPAPESAVAAPPAGFVETTVFSGLTNPTVVRFAGDGRVFVAEKSGVIKVFDNISDTTPSLFTDLSTTDGTPNNVLATKVHNFWDRGLLGMALHPNFPTTPYVYVLYTHDAAIGGTAPRWGSPGAVSDGCPTPPGPTSDGCVVSGRLSRLQAAGNVMTGTEQVLIEDWCQQYPSHSVGTVEFGPDGALYASAGDGASFTFTDYGQDGSPVNPCGDPPGGVGGSMTPPSAEGGALRSQDIRTSSDPTTLDGSIIRVDPTTGAALPSNPLFASPDANTRRIVAHGLRNPFRFTFRPGTSELWVGDVGWSEYEEINRILNPADATVENFGWPCYEGSPRQSGYDSANLAICETLYANPSADTKPYFAYHHANKVDPADTCPTGSSSVSGLAFEFAPQSSSYPAEYQGALFFADYSRDCIWVMKKGGNPIPSPGQIDPFVNGAANPVNIEFGPDGNLYYADFDGGTIRKIQPDTPPPTPGLVAAYSFNEGTGTSIADASGTGNAGTIGTATWTTQGRHGNALVFNGADARVTVPDTPSLRLTGAMTLEAWVYPTAISGVWRDLVYKGNDNYFLSADSCCSGRPVAGGIFSGSHGQAHGPANLALNTWTHLAGTYDGQTLRLYQNGVQVTSIATTGTLATSSQPLTIGGDPIYGQYLAGRIDEVRVYSVARTQAEIQADMNTPIGGGPPPPDTEPPTAPGSLTATPAGQTQINLAWQASTDNVTVSGYRVERCQGAGCSNFAEIATPAGTTFVDTGLTAGTTYRYRVRATDAAANLSAYSNIATATTNSPNAAPTATIVTPATGTTWKVGDVISFSGSASDPEDGNLAASRLSWTLVLQHCPTTCHSHTVQEWSGVAGGSFVTPDHEYPSHLELTLAATDSGGLTDTETRRLDPRTVVLTFQTSPTGLQLTVGSSSDTAPFTRTVIEGSTNSISAPSPQTLGGTTYEFVSWSDGGAATHNVVANAPATYTATFQSATSADLEIVKTGSKSESTATWTLAVTNLGPSTAQNVVVTDTLHSRLTFVSAPGCSYASANRVVTCALSALASGGTASFTITTTITGSGGGWISNTAQVTSATADPTTANNTSTARVRAR